MVRLNNKIQMNRKITRMKKLILEMAKRTRKKLNAAWQTDIPNFELRLSNIFGYFSYICKIY